MRFSHKAGAGILAACAVIGVSLSVGGSSDAEGPSRVSLGGTPLEVPPDAWTTFPQILSVREAIQTRDGWLLLDRTGTRIHLLSGGGTLAATFGREGEGPGELKYPAGMVLVADTLWIVNATGTRIDGFTHDGTFLRRVRPAPPCGAPYLDDAISFEKDVVIAVRCLGFATSKRHILRVDLTSGTASLMTPHPNDDPGDSGDPTRLVTTPDGLLAGSMFQRCLRPTDGRPTDRRVAEPHCLDIADRVLLPSAVHDSLTARRSRRAFPGLLPSIPPHYPYLTDAFHTSRGLMVVQPEGESTAVIRTLTGPRPMTLRIPDRILPFLGWDQVLLMEDVLEGVRIALVQLPEETP